MEASEVPDVPELTEPHRNALLRTVISIIDAACPRV